MENMILYQISLRALTPDGTLKSAKKMLNHIKELGANWIYLCPVWIADADENRTTWSPRQIASSAENPKNPYKMADYFNVDEEYGNNADLLDFVSEAHREGLKIMFDLVYLHCGVNAVFLKEHPDWVKQDENGKPLVGANWPFARINYENSGVREYLYSNMELFSKEYKVDGFRCDVGDAIPLDFWEEGIKRCKKINENLVMIDEGIAPEFVNSGVFDLSYRCTAFGGMGWHGFMESDDKAEAFRKTLDFTSSVGYKHLNLFESHDLASDHKDRRMDLIYSSEITDLCYFIIYTIDGVPFIWNGNEILDRGTQNMFSNRFCGKNIGIDWSNAMSVEGQNRLSLMKELNKMRMDYPFLYDGELILREENKDNFIAFERRKDKKRLLIFANFGTEEKIIKTDGIKKIIIERGAKTEKDEIKISPLGFAAAEI